MTNTPSGDEATFGSSGSQLPGEDEQLGASPSLPTSTSVSAGASDDVAWPPAPAAASTVEPAEESSSTTDVAKDEAANVKDTAVSAGQDVAATAKDEAANVAAETKQQAKSLFGSVSSEVQSQAGTQQQKVASSVRSLSDELKGMASGSSESGPLTDLTHQAAQKGGEIAHWLENHEPRDVLREVQSFARRRPVLFLVLCGAAGVVAGRLTRGAVAANTSIDSPDPEPRSDAGADDVLPQRALTTTESVPEQPAYSTAATDPGYPADAYASVDPTVDPALQPVVEPTYRPGEVR